MIFSRIKLALFSRFTLAFLGLAFCVFTWGLQYKLSLYAPSQAVSRTIPQAKLLSRDEANTESESPIIEGTSVADKTMRLMLFSVLLSLLLVLKLGDSLVLLWEKLNSELPWRLRSQASFSAFFFRPPPILA